MRRVTLAVTAIALALASWNAGAANCNYLWQKGAREDKVVNDATRIYKRAMDRYFDKVAEVTTELTGYVGREETPALRRDISKILTALAEYTEDVADIADEVVHPIEQQLETLSDIEIYCDAMYEANSRWHDQKTRVLEDLIESIEATQGKVGEFGRWLRNAKDNPARLMRRLELFGEELGR